MNTWKTCEHLASKAAGNKDAEHPPGVAVSLELHLFLCPCLQDELYVYSPCQTFRSNIYLSGLDFLEAYSEFYETRNDQ